MSRGRNLRREKEIQCTSGAELSPPPSQLNAVASAGDAVQCPPPPYRAVLSRSARSPAGRALSPSPANEFTPQPSLKMTAGRMAMGRLLVKLSTRANLIRHGIAHPPRTELSSAHPILCFRVYKLTFRLFISTLIAAGYCTFVEFP